MGCAGVLDAAIALFKRTLNICLRRVTEATKVSSAFAPTCGVKMVANQHALVSSRKNGTPKGSAGGLGQKDPGNELSTRAQGMGLIGKSVAHLALLNGLNHVAPFDVEVFLVGETGVGKERYAQFLHACSQRAPKAFVSLNCGAIPESLFENELFGHSAGAYTDAKSTQVGLVEAANGGTLFLDEVDGLSRNNQVKLLRLLQEKEYRRLGDSRLRRANVRLISAMNRDPESAVDDGLLRKDLFYRLCVQRMEIPPLRNRPDDVEALVRHFASRYSSDYGRSQPMKFDAGAMRKLCAFNWPGNIRQLENMIRTLACRPSTSVVQASELPMADSEDAVVEYHSMQTPALAGLTFAEAKRRLVEEFEVEYIREMLSRTSGNISRAAELSGKNRRAFFELMRKHDIDAEPYRA